MARLTSTPDRRSGGYDARFFERLSAVEDRSFWFRSRNALILWALGAYAPGARSMLEIGCGTGHVLSAIHLARPAVRLVGSELLAEGLEVARRRLPGVELVELDARRLPWRDEFDVIGAFDVLEHIDEAPRVLVEMGHALRPGGLAVVTVPQHPWLWSEFDELAQHVCRYRRDQLVEQTDAAGLQTLRVTSFTALLLPLMALSRRRRTAGTPDPLRALLPPRPLNRALEAILTAERAAIRRGVDFPAGGSLLLVAAKPR